MQAIVFALISYFGWGVGDIFGAVTTRKIGALATVFWVSLLGSFIFTFYIPFDLTSLVHLTIPILLFNILLGIIFMIGSLCLNSAFKLSNVSLTGTIVSCYTALTVLLSILFLRETISLNQFVAIAVILLGVLLSTFDLNDLKKGKVIKDRGTRLALVAMVCYGVYFAFIKIIVREIGWFWPNYITFLLFPLIYLYIKLQGIVLQKPNYKNALMPIIICTLLLRFGDFSFNIGISKGMTAVVAPISGAFPTLFALLSFFVFKDPIKKQQILGIIVTLVGIVLLSALSI